MEHTHKKILLYAHIFVVQNVIFKLISATFDGTIVKIINNRFCDDEYNIK